MLCTHAARNEQPRKPGVAGRLGAASPFWTSGFHCFGLTPEAVLGALLLPFKCFLSKEQMMALTLAFRLYHSLTPWSTQRQGEFELTKDVKSPSFQKPRSLFHFKNATKISVTDSRAKYSSSLDPVVSNTGPLQHFPLAWKA